MKSTTILSVLAAALLSGCYLSDLAGPEDQPGKTITIEKTVPADTTDPKPISPAAAAGGNRLEHQ